MKKLSGILILLVLAGGAFAQTSWKGEAGLADAGSLPEGYYAASNEFPRNTILQVESLKTKAVVKVRVLKRLESALDSRFVLISAKAGKDLGLQGPESLMVSVKVDSSLEGLRSSLLEDRTENPDPEVNPTFVYGNPVQNSENPPQVSTTPWKPNDSNTAVTLIPSNLVPREESFSYGPRVLLPQEKVLLSTLVPQMGIIVLDTPRLSPGLSVPYTNQMLALLYPGFSPLPDGPRLSPSAVIKPGYAPVASLLPTPVDLALVQGPGRLSSGSCLPSTSSVPLALLPELALGSSEEKPWVSPGLYLPPVGTLTALIVPEKIQVEDKAWLSSPVALADVQNLALAQLLYPDPSGALTDQRLAGISSPVFLKAENTWVALVMPQIQEPIQPVQDWEGLSSPVAIQDPKVWVSLILPQIQALETGEGALALAPEGYDPSSGENRDDLDGKLAFLPPREGPLFNPAGPDLPGISGSMALLNGKSLPLMTPSAWDLLNGPQNMSSPVAYQGKSQDLALILPGYLGPLDLNGPELSPAVAGINNGTQTVAPVIKPTMADLLAVAAKPDLISTQAIKPSGTPAKPNVALVVPNKPQSVAATPQTNGVKPGTQVTILTTKPQSNLNGKYTAVAAPLKGDLLGNLPVIASYQSQGDYIQLASFKDEKTLLKSLDKVKSHIPLALMVKDGTYRLVAGPVKRDQTGFLLNHYQTQGFKQALVVKGSR